MLFLDNFLIVSAQVLILFLLMFIGFICNKIGFLNEESNKCLSNIVVTIVAPCVIISSFLSSAKGSSEEIKSLILDIGVVALISIAVHIFMILISHLFLRDKSDASQRVLRFASVFSNCGFIALPLAQSLIDMPYGIKTGSLYCAVYIAIFNITMWTYGYMLMSKEKKLSAKKIFLNPGIIGVLVGLIIIVLPLMGVNLSGKNFISTIIEGVLTHVSNLNVPLPMLIIGYSLANTNFKTAFKDLKTFVVLGIRLIIFPLITLAVLMLLNVKSFMLITIITCVSAPVGATTTMFSTKFNLDTDLSVRLVALSTLFSLITMPLIVGLSQTLVF